MKKFLTKLTYLIFTLFLTHNIKAHFQQVDHGYHDNFHGISSKGDTIIIGGTINTFRSFDGGNTWDSILVVDPVFNQMVGVTNIETIEFAPDGSAYFSAGNLTKYTGVYKSVNNGESWNRVVNIPSTNFTEGGDVKVAENGEIYACSDKYNLYFSKNDGLTWSLIRVNKTFNWGEICIVNENSVYVSSYGRIITYNGKSAIGKTIGNDSFLSIHFPNDSVGYTIGSDGSLYKTETAGINWSLVNNITTSGSPVKIRFIDENTGYLLTNSSLLKTVNGGITWERKQLSTYTSLNNIHFAKNDAVYITGDNNTLLKTNDINSVVFEPIAKFESSTNIYCSDSTITFTNLSAQENHYTYSWMLNGEEFSTDFNAEHKIINNESTSRIDTISLVVSNGTTSGTLSMNITIQPALNAGNLTPYILKDSVCIGDPIQIGIKSPSVGTYYSLLQEGELPYGMFGSTNTVFNAVKIDSNTTFHVTAYKYSSCGMYEDTVEITASIKHTDQVKLNVDKDIVCNGEEVIISIPNPQDSVSYTLMENSTEIESVKNEGNGIRFSPIDLDLTQSFYTIAEHPEGCTETIDDVVQVKVENVDAKFGYTSQQVSVNEKVFLKNTSYNPNGTYEWTYKNKSGQEIKSNSTPEYLRYNSTIEDNVQLIATTPHGCKDTTSKTIKAFRSEEECVNGIFSIKNVNTKLLSSHVDKFGNLFFANQFGTWKNEVVLFNGETDTLKADFSSAYGVQDDAISITKVTKKGFPSWIIKINITDANWGNTTIKSDDDGNIYVAFSHDHNGWNDSSEVVSADGSIHKFKSNYPAGPSDYVHLAKFDQYGVLQWRKGFAGANGDVIVRLEFDNNGNLIFLPSNGDLIKVDPNGNELWRKEHRLGFSGITVDKENYIYARRGAVTHFGYYQI